MDQVFLQWMVNFFTQIIYIHVDNVCTHVEVHTPYLLQNIHARQYFIFVDKRISQHTIFCSSQYNSYFATANTFAVPINDQIIYGNSISSNMSVSCPSGEPIYSCPKLIEFKW